MARTQSNTFELGKIAPSFILPDTTDGQTKTLANLKGEHGTALFFICNHCPFVIHINEELVALANDYAEKGIAFIAISSNDVVNYPQDGPDQMKRVAQELGYPFPYLYDESQEVAKSYNAACTPDLYLFDAELNAVYHGQLDDSRPGNDMPVTGADFRYAIDNLLTGKEFDREQEPSMGCGIKWKQ